MLPDVGMAQMYSKSVNVNDLGFAWTGWFPSLHGPALLLVFTALLPGGLPCPSETHRTTARLFAMPFRDTPHHPYICPFWRKHFGAPLFSDLGIRMASCSYIYTVATTTCASRISVLVDHRKRPPVQVTVATTTCASRISALVGN